MLICKQYAKHGPLRIKEAVKSVPHIEGHRFSMRANTKEIKTYSFFHQGQSTTDVYAIRLEK
ncbi:Uncharacterised protein [Legionella steigerwaltii]|uniref:Uncharacterized protein n=1 Tax=Legionella steigerwaltii TaxID=460 RepID=A0A378L940_9GAMM|nr:hypothetical protein Lstg_0206 [Legionella steigerwaltii]STY23333.1 Uncharacterised protein [Legionella steigerwaltii]